jgi:serine/threonine-protein kinase
MPDDLSTEPAEGALFTLEGTHYRFIRMLDTVAGAQRLLARREPLHGPEQLVVIKRLPSRARWAQRRRLAHEAWVARRLAHPGLARVLHAKTGVHRPLLIMEHVEGARLERVLT